MKTLPVDTVDERSLVDAATRLRLLARKADPGGCKLASRGAACICPLCDIDRLLAASIAARRAMPMTEGDSTNGG